MNSFSGVLIIEKINVILTSMENIFLVKWFINLVDRCQKDEEFLSILKELGLCFGIILAVVGYIITYALMAIFVGYSEKNIFAYIAVSVIASLVVYGCIVLFLGVLLFMMGILLCFVVFLLSLI